MDCWGCLMDFKWVKKSVFVFFCLIFCVGFRVYPDKKWQIDPTSSTTASRKVFVSIITSGTSMDNNLPSTDALSSAGSTLTESQLLDSILTDFNSISASGLILARDTDSDFNAYSTDHLITIETGTAAGTSTGEARPQFSGRNFVSCKIVLSSKGYQDAKTFVALVTHELGHCVGLEHPQDTVNAVMSYFHEDDLYRLAIDDKMGIVHLYPKDPASGDEKSTLGLSCSRQ
jgi:hypothetical protein